MDNMVRECTRCDGNIMVKTFSMHKQPVSKYYVNRGIYFLESFYTDFS